MTFTFLIIAVSGLVILEIALNHRQQSRGIAEARRRRQRLSQFPSISVIRPVRGADVGAAENYAAALDTGYPGEVETIFVFDDETDPGYPIAAAAVEKHRASGGHGSASLIVAGQPPRGVTGKLHAMMVGERAATHELIAFGDSDTRPDQEVLRATVETLLTTPKAGCSFAPVVCNQPAQKAGDVGYATLINAWYGPSVATASCKTGDVPFIMGQLMVFTRDCLRDIGGVSCARGHLVDDMAIGHCVVEKGWRNVMAPHPLYIATGGMDIIGFFGLFRRWLLFSRNGLPFDFVRPMWLRGIEFWVATASFVFALYTHHWLAALAPAAALGVFQWSCLSIGRQFGGARVALQHWWVPFFLPVIAPIEVGVSMVHKKVDWRGRAYELDANARLA
ncbi:MAG: ceramide glucosyltransferase [Myxococcales bacterium]|nr:ceramide glucosyltransferase [Myxococcales bacterium]